MFRDHVNGCPPRLTASGFSILSVLFLGFLLLKFGDKQAFSFLDCLASYLDGRTNPDAIQRAGSCQPIGLE
jgi:hypothetical protein